jgi:hypothetical protein
MRLCTFQAWIAPPATPPPASEFARRIWAQASAADRVQHVRVRSGEARLDIGILLMAVSDDKARAVGARICTAALAAGPDTHGWTLQQLPAPPEPSSIP